MAVALAIILLASAIDSLASFTAGFVLLFVLTGIVRLLRAPDPGRHPAAGLRGRLIPR